MKHMRELVETFYSDMSNKISCIKEVQKQKIREMKARKKYLTSRVKDDTSGSLATNPDTVSAWTKAKPFYGNKEIFHVTSMKKSIQQGQSLELLTLHNFTNLNSLNVRSDNPL